MTDRQANNDSTAFDADALTARVAAVRSRIEAACRRSDRNPGEVTLIGVGKTWPRERLQAAVSAGITDLGENYVQEAIDKIDAWAGSHPVWHFIGPVQSNKTRAIAERFDWVQTVDRFKIARRLSEQRPPERGPLNIALQINISDDPAKAGVHPDEAADLARRIQPLPHVRIAGLMTITAQNLDEGELRRQFTELKTLRDTLINIAPECRSLSMGMSRDFEIAIECGATQVRVGSAVFGQRQR